MKLDIFENTASSFGLVYSVIFSESVINPDEDQIIINSQVKSIEIKT